MNQDIDPSARIAPSAIIGDNVVIGPLVRIDAGAIIHDNVEISAGTHVGAQCILGEPLADYYRDPDGYRNPRLRIGERSTIRSGTIIYADNDLGPDFECGHRVTIRERARIADHVRIGTLSDIQGHCSIGRYVRLHSNVHIGQGSTIEEFVWIFPYVVLTNDPHPPSNHLVGVTVKRFAIIATMSVVLPGVTIGQDALVGASSMVKRDVNDEDVVSGNPAQRICSVRDIKSKHDRSQVYPWREQFSRGMPWQESTFAQWAEETGYK